MFVLAEGLGFEAELDIAKGKAAEIAASGASKQSGVVGDAAVLVDGEGDGEVHIQPVQDPKAPHDIGTDLMVEDARAIAASVSTGSSAQDQWVEGVVEVNTGHVVHATEGDSRLGVEHPVDIAPRTELLQLERGVEGSAGGLCVGGRGKPSTA